MGGAVPDRLLPHSRGFAHPFSLISQASLSFSGTGPWCCRRGSPLICKAAPTASNYSPRAGRAPLWLCRAKDSHRKDQRRSLCYSTHLRGCWSPGSPHLCQPPHQLSLGIPWLGILGERGRDACPGSGSCRRWKGQRQGPWCLWMNPHMPWGQRWAFSLVEKAPSSALAGGYQEGPSPVRTE